VNPAGSLDRSDQLRLFVALRLPPDVVERLVAWQARELGGAAGVRLLAADHLHITVAFLGATSVAEREAIVRVVEGAACGAPRPTFRASRYRETPGVGMVVLAEQPVGDPPVQPGAALAERLMLGLEQLGVYRRERRAWLPHVTVARFRTRPRLTPGVPDLGELSPSGVALYHSVLRPAGAQYEILDAVPLGGS
jgi:2'-5' RNA ligase